MTLALLIADKHLGILHGKGLATELTEAAFGGKLIRFNLELHNLLPTYLCLSSEYVLKNLIKTLILTIWVGNYP
jgi:hypothetical protein